MANRSYLYSINEIPGIKVRQTLTVKGLSEFRWGVPLTYLILLSGKTNVCDALIGEFDAPAALAGDYSKGVDRLERFSELMREWNVNHVSVFERQMQDALSFLKDDTNIQQYMYLDITEIFNIGGENDVDGYKLNVELVGEALDAGNYEQMNKHILDGDLKTNWEEHLGLDYWSDVLYFHFEKPIEYKSPFAKSEDEIKRHQSDVKSLADAMSSSS